VNPGEFVLGRLLRLQHGPAALPEFGSHHLHHLRALDTLRMPGRREVMQVVASEFRQRGGTVLEPKEATEDELARIHDRAYLSLIRETSGRATALDVDTFTSPDSYEVALLAAGAAVASVDRVLDGGGARALAMVRPPGHHAERNRAMGFCFFNNIAIAAAHARARGLERVAIVDYDVHHGNGTQWAFYDDPSVLFISSHQYPYYPGTGAATDTGTGRGAGFTINLPLEAGATDADYDVVYTTITRPVLRQFRPDLILVSAGFDAFVDDPLGGMRVTAAGFVRLTALLAGVADECCSGRIAAVTEGGYDLAGFAACLRGATSALAGEVTPAQLDAAGGSGGAVAPRGRATIASVLPHLTSFWTL
jgi:acetoin utilization deacetylase AcuC-like enzyme